MALYAVHPCLMDPLHATIEEFAADGYTHIECFCPWCRNDEVEADQSGLC